MNMLENMEPNVTHRQLFSTFSYAADDFTKAGFLEKGHDLEMYCPDGYTEYVNIFWSDKLNSFAYLGDNHRFIAIDPKHLKTYNLNINAVIDFLRTELDILPSTKSTSHLQGFLHYLGNTFIEKRKIAIFFARRVSDQAMLNQIEDFFTQSPTNLPKLILTSSRPPTPRSLITKVKIISIHDLLEHSSSQKLFNMTYIANILFRSSNQEYKPYIHCTEDGGTLTVGNEQFKIKGDKQRQIIKIMCNSYQFDPDKPIRWNSLLDEADMNTNSRVRDFFKDSPILKKVINYGDGFIWFEDINQVKK